LLFLAFCVLLSLVSAGCPDANSCDVGETCCLCVSVDGNDYYCAADCADPSATCPDESDVLENTVDEVDHEQEDDGEKSECGCFSGDLLANAHPEDHSDHYDGDDGEIERQTSGTDSTDSDTAARYALALKRLAVDVCSVFDEFSACATANSCASKYLSVVCGLRIFASCSGCNGVDAKDPGADRSADDLVSGIQTLKSSVEDYIENKYPEIDSIDITYVPGTKEFEIKITASDETRDNSDLPDKSVIELHSIFDVEDGTFEVGDVQNSKKRLRLAEARVYVHNENSASGLVVGLFAIVLAFRALF